VHYKQVSDEERYQIAALRQVGHSMAEIAEVLERHRSTVYREVARNRSTHDNCYRPNQAGEQTRARRRRSRRNRRYLAEDFAVAERLLRAELSPEQIVGRLRMEERPVMSIETIYQQVRADKKVGGRLYLHLRGARKLKRKRYGQKDSRGRLPGKKMMGDRPKEVELRNNLLHWEMDTIHGFGPACVVTVVERCSRLTRIGPLTRAGSTETTEGLCGLLALEPYPIQTITADNGSEFHGYRTIEQRLGTYVYFATPHHAWERGTNENTNGLIRQYLPKGMDLSKLTQQQCSAIAEKLNNRPRKCLGYRTPNEVYYQRALTPV
jgi:transposase, IS30 family